MSNKEPGYVYILTRSTSGRLHTCKNPSFREDWVKIGKSSRILLLALSCQKTIAMLLVPIKALSISLIMGRCWMR